MVYAVKVLLTGLLSFSVGLICASACVDHEEQTKQNVPPIVAAPIILMVLVGFAMVVAGLFMWIWS